MMLMVKTRAEVKIKLGQWIEEQKQFTTEQARAEMQPMATNILLSPNRLVKYIKGTGKVEYDSGIWKVKIKPFRGLKIDAITKQRTI